MQPAGPFDPDAGERQSIMFTLSRVNVEVATNKPPPAVSLVINDGPLDRARPRMILRSEIVKVELMTLNPRPARARDEAMRREPRKTEKSSFLTRKTEGPGKLSRVKISTHLDSRSPL
jgi:hypothetical protein